MEGCVLLQVGPASHGCGCGSPGKEGVFAAVIAAAEPTQVQALNLTNTSGFSGVWDVNTLFTFVS